LCSGHENVIVLGIQRAAVSHAVRRGESILDKEPGPVRDYRVETFKQRPHRFPARLFRLWRWLDR
jgi:hypothetical protein